VYFLLKQTGINNRKSGTKDCEGKQTKLKDEAVISFNKESKHILCEINDQVKMPDKGRRPEEVTRRVQY